MWLASGFSARRTVVNDTYPSLARRGPARSRSVRQHAQDPQELDRPASSRLQWFRRALRRRAYRQSLPVVLVRAHGRAPFPPGLRGREEAGADLVMLDVR